MIIPHTMKRILTILLIAAAVIPASCRGNAQHQQQGEQAGFPYPSVPSSLTTPRERASYLITHFWDNIDFADSIDEARRAVYEQGFADFISVFEPADTASRRQAMLKLVQRSRDSQSAADMVDEMAEVYLYSPESPVYNEEYFITYLDALLGSGLLSEAESMRPRFMLDEAMKNRVGTTAADFGIIRADGSKTALSDITARSPYTLLIFVDPDCETCAETVEAIRNNAGMNALVDSGELAIAGVYDGGDSALWKRSQDHYPSNWITGMTEDGGVTDGLYAVATYPTLYLLGSGGVVLQKNTGIDKVMLQLNGN